MAEPLLDRAAIAARIPHAGRMVLLDAVDAWDDAHIVCRTDSHRESDHPLAIAGRLSSACGVEYAAQAMALHGGLTAPVDPENRPRLGFLASVRGVTMAVARLDDLPGPLTIEATRESGDASRVLYAFEIRGDGRVLVSGRAAVILQADDLVALR